MHNLKKKFIVYFLACLSIILLSPPQTWADTNVGGNITTDTTWTKANSPYIVTGTVQVLQGVTLTIEPGVTVKFNLSTNNEPFPLNVGGQLLAIGNEQERITFVFNGNSQCPSCPMIQFVDGSLAAIFDENGKYLSGSIIKYCTIDHITKVQINSSSPYIAFNIIDGTVISLDKSSSVIESNEIKGSSQTQSALGSIVCDRSPCQILNNKISIRPEPCSNASDCFSGSAIVLSLQNNIAVVENNEIEILSPILEPQEGNPSMLAISVDGSSAEIRGNIVKNNAIRSDPLFIGRGLYSTSNVNVIWNDLSSASKFGVWVGGDRNFPIEVTFNYNNLEGLDNISPSNIDATNNYWGTTDTSIIDSKIFDYYDDITLGKVNYHPITTSAYKKVDFSSDPLYGNFPLQVTFSNNSMGIINSVTWDFGDGETSNEINPVHVYKSAGTFNVSLTVIGRNGEITETKSSNYIIVGTPNYTLSLSKAGNGSVKVNGTTHPLPWSGEFSLGTNVQIEAISDSGWSFTNWTGDYTGSTNPTTLNISGKKNITANFSQNCDRILTINVNPIGSGTVNKNPDKNNYCPDEQVTLTAIPNTGYNFSSWIGVNSSNGVTAQVSMSNNKTVTANFSQIPVVNYPLSITKAGNGSIKVNGTTHELPWSGEFSSGTNVQIEAMSDSGWSFTNWTGDYTGSTNPTTINISGNKNITANFSQNCDRSLTININPSGSGTVTKNPDKANYCPNEQVTLTASPNSGYTFSSWDGVDSNSETTASITMNNNRTVTVNFNQQTLNGPDISVDPITQVFANIPVGDSSMPQTLTISNTGSGDLAIGTLSITGNDASQFIKQNETCSGQTLTPSANCTVNVIFSPTATGSFDSILNIPSNDLDEPNVTVSLKGGSGADITGSWISLFQQCKGTKCKVNGKFNVHNTGNKDALSSSVKFYLSDDGVYHEGNSFLKEAKTGTLKVGKSKSISLSYSFPSGVSATDKYIIAVIDADNTVMEANESNNIIIYGPILRANLTGMWTSLTQQCKGGKCKIKGVLNIQNIGYQNAASFVRFYLSDDSTYDEGDMFLKQTSTGTLKVGKSKKISLSYSFLSGVSATDKYIIAVIDADNSVLEVNEGDNNIIYGPLP